MNGEPRMVGLPRTKRVSDLIYVFSAILLASFTPLYMWDTHVTARPRPESIGVAELARQPVARLLALLPRPVFRVSVLFCPAPLLQEMSEASPSIPGIPTYQTMNMINDQGLSAEYTELISGFTRKDSRT